MQEDKFIKARDKVLSQYPKLSKPFELNSDGYFFIGNLVGKLVKDLCIFYNNYELTLEKEKAGLSLAPFIAGKEKLYSLYHFLDISYQDIYDYLDEVCNVHGLGDSMFYMLGPIEDRLKAIGRYLLQKDGNWPIQGELISVGDIEVWSDRKSQTLICAYLFEIVYLINHVVINEKLKKEYYTESLIAFIKLNLIFNINEDI